MKLFIVESPSKAKTIQKYLGLDYICMATAGHIMDIPHNLNWLDTVNWDNLPYKNIARKHDVINKLIKTGKLCDTIYICTDPDREGELIAYNIAMILGIDIKTAIRLRFDRITKDAILNAIDCGGQIDLCLLKAQNTRRIIDLIYGFRISPFLCKSIGGKYSAGRCQSPALGLIINHNEQVLESEKYIKCNRKVEIDIIIGCLKRTKNLENIDNVEEWYSNIVNNSNVKFVDSKYVKHQESAASPFITSSYQIYCNRFFGLSSKMSMSIAQKLYETGWITYPRTDSHCISHSCNTEIRNYISSKYGIEYYCHNYYKAKQNAQEAHEAIRPCKIMDKYITGISDLADKIMIAIKNRTLCSQMIPCTYEGYNHEFKLSSDDCIYNLYEEYCTNAGYKIVLGSISTKLIKNNYEGFYFIENTRIFDSIVQPMRPYKESDFVHKLEDVGIGRPSTYSNIVSTLLNRKYVSYGLWHKTSIDCCDWNTKNGKLIKNIETIEIGGYKNILLCTDLGKIIYNTLSNNFTSYLEVDFTKKLELNLDNIASGNTDLYPQLIKTFDLEMKNVLSVINKFQKLHSSMETLFESNNYQYILEKGVKYSKYLRLDKKTGSKIYRDYAKDIVNYDDIAKLFELDIIGTSSIGHDIEYRIGKYGKYIHHNGINISCPERPTLDIAQKLIDDRVDNIICNIGKRYSIIMAKYGKCLKCGNKFAKITDDIDYSSWNVKDCELYMSKYNNTKAKKRYYNKKIRLI